jgi:leucyl aminopeptidase (aminopeptidase T)
MAASKPPKSAPPAPARASASLPPASLPPTSLPPSTPRDASLALALRRAQIDPPLSVAPSSRPPPSKRPTLAPKAIDFALMTPAARMLQELLVVRLGERVVILHDEANASLALAFEHAAAEAGPGAQRIQLEDLAPRPWTSCPAPVLEAMRTATVTILAVRPEDGEYDFRAAIIQAARVARTRHVHMVGVSGRTFVASMAAPVSRVVGLLDAVRVALQPTSKISARSPGGTQVEIEMAPHLRWYASGGVVQPGDWINVPYGQLTSSPATVRGVYVADASMGGHLGARTGSLAQKPVRLVIDGGRVKSVECADHALRLHIERFLVEGENHDRVGCVNLGANVGIVAPAGEILHDEHMPGLHVSLGNNYRERSGANWTARGQLAFTMASSDVDLDGLPLIRRGRYVRFV